MIKKLPENNVNYNLMKVTKKERFLLLLPDIYTSCYVNKQILKDIAFEKNENNNARLKKAKLLKSSRPNWLIELAQ